MAAASPWKSDTLILMASSAAVIVEFREPTMGSMHTKPNVPFVAMCMEQMDPTCTKDDGRSVRMVPGGSSTGKVPTVDSGDSSRDSCNNNFTFLAHRFRLSLVDFKEQIDIVQEGLMNYQNARFPEGAVKVGSTPSMTEETVAPGILNKHLAPKGKFGYLVVEEGSLQFVWKMRRIMFLTLIQIILL